jgi:hypothetical protein
MRRSNIDHSLSTDPMSDEREVVWGWRRSTWDEKVNRLVYFAADCEISSKGATLRRSRLILIRGGGELDGMLGRASKLQGGRVELGNSILSVSIGPIGEIDKERVKRLDKCRRHVVKDLGYLPETPEWRKRLNDIHKSHPRLLVYAGSGLSYEAGVPMLAEMHELFGVDSGVGRGFCLGDSDPLLDRLAENGFHWFSKQVERFHNICAGVNPSESHRLLVKAHREGVVSFILTDNVDDIFERLLRIRTIKTRGDGLISVKYQGMPDLLKRVKSVPHALLVIGVSADRRGIIESLSSSVPTIVINPALPVSPESKNLDYLDLLGFDGSGASLQGHVFIKRPAKTCLAEVLSILEY